MHALTDAAQRLFLISDSRRSLGVARALLAFVSLLSAGCLAHGVAVMDGAALWLWLLGIVPGVLAGWQLRRGRTIAATHLLAAALLLVAAAGVWRGGAAAWPLAYAPLAALWVVSRGHGRPAGFPYILLLPPAAFGLYALGAPWLPFTLTALVALAFLWPLAAAPVERPAWSPEAVSQLRSLKRLSQLLAQADTVRQMFINTRQEVLPLFNATGISIFLVDDDEQTLEWAYGFEYGAEVDLSGLGPLLMDRGFAGHVARTGEPLLVNRNLPQQMARFNAIQIGAAPGAWLGVPLVVVTRTIGVLVIENGDDREAFDRQDVELLAAIAGPLASTLHIFIQTREGLERLNNLFLASRRIIQAQDASEVYQALSGHAIASDGIDGAHLVVQNPRAPERLIYPALEVRGLAGYAPGERPLQEIPFATLVPHDAVRHVAPSDPALDGDTRRLLQKNGVGALTLIPIRRDAEWFGSLALLRQMDAFLTDEEVQPFVTLCNQAAAALSNHALLRETDTLYRTSRELSQVITRDDALTIAIHELAQHLGAPQCRVVLYDERLGYGRMELAYRNIDEPHVVQFPMEGDPVYERLKDNKEPLILREQETAERIVAGYLRPFDARSTLLVPAYAQQELIGFIAVDSYSAGRHFTPGQVNFARTLVDQLSTQMENLVLFDEALTRAQDMLTLNQIGTMISGTLNTAELAEIVQEQVGRLMDNSIFLLAVYDGHTRHYRPLLTSRYGERFASPPRQLSENEVLYDFLHHKQEPSDDERMELARQAGLRDLYVSGWTPESALWVPMQQEGEPTGLLSVQSYRPHAYDENHQQLLRTIATQAGLALANAELFQQTEQTLAELRTIFEITQSATASPNPNERLQRLAEALHETFQDATVAIMSVERETRTLNLLAAAGDARREAPPLGNGAIRDSVFNDQPLLINDLREIAGYDPQGDALSQMVVPLTVGERTIGVVNVESPTTDAFTDTDLRLVQTLSVTVAASIESSRLFGQIQSANERLRELDRLKMQFLANMSHELRTPLNSIIGFSRVILKGIDGPVTNEQEEDLEAIYNSGQHLLSIINDILDVARIEAGKLALVFEIVDLSALAERAISTIRGLLRDKSIQLVVDIEPELPQIEADPVRLRQILLNLLSNAAKFTEQGEIRLRMERYKPYSGSEIGRSVPLPAVCIIVSDTGPGIAPEHYGKVFEAFEQIDASSTRIHEGTGLGLPITKRLVDLHQGEITFDSKIEQGTTFTIVIPVRQPPGRDVINQQKEALKAAMARYRSEAEEQGNRPEEPSEVEHDSQRSQGESS